MILTASNSKSLNKANFLTRTLGGLMGVMSVKSLSAALIHIKYYKNTLICKGDHIS
jgi:hypothetical protein